MSFSALPADLQDLVIGFCYKIRYNELKRDLDIISEINRWCLPPCLLPRTIFCRETYHYEHHPTVVYRPLNHFHSKLRLFNMLQIHEVLNRLDFRKREVRTMGSRWDWLENLQKWEFVGLFSVFYRNIEKFPQHVKPNWLCFKIGRVRGHDPRVWVPHGHAAAAFGCFCRRVPLL